MEASLQTQTVRSMSGRVFRSPEHELIRLAPHSLDFKKILQCIARFGDELHLQATHEGVSLSRLHRYERD